MNRILLVCIVTASAFSAPATAADKEAETNKDRSGPQGNEDLTVPFFITSQDPGLDWWYRIPPNSGPVIETTSELYRGQRFLALPFVVQYARNEAGEFDLVYSIRQTAPDGETTEILSDAEFKAPSAASHIILPLPKYPGGFYEEEDALGAYTFTVTLRDRLAEKTVSAEAEFSLIEWKAPEPFDSQKLISTGTTEFYRTNDPDWLYAAFVSPDLQMEQENTTTGFNGALLGFFQAAFASNEFLLPHLETAFPDAGPTPRRNILLLRALLNEPPLPQQELTEREQAFQDACHSLEFSDPYETLLFPDQLDRLWGEFFATGRYKPVRRLIDALSLAPYKETADAALENGKMPEGKDALHNFWRGMTFKAAVWSLGANCKNHRLVRQYCAWALNNEDLPANDAALLRAILSRSTKNQESNTGSAM